MIIDRLKTFLASCPSIAEELHIDFTDDTATSYGIMPTGIITSQRYMDGGKLMQYSFVIYIRECTAEDLERIANSQFLETFAEWLDTHVPELDEGFTADHVETANGMLFDVSADGTTGLYQLQCQLFYERSAQ
jgi:hypothetical protein